MSEGGFLVGLGGCWGRRIGSRDMSETKDLKVMMCLCV